MKREIYFCENEENIKRVFAGGAEQTLKEAFALSGQVYSRKDLGKEDFSDVVAVFSTWGMPHLEREEIKNYFPSLKALFYAAGSVQPFARPFLEEGVRVFSAWKANAVPVVEYAVAEILLANKGFYQLISRTKEDYEKATQFFTHFKGNYQAKVGILGDGAIGGEVIRRLKGHSLEILVYSITMSEERAKELNVKRASLEEIFKECDVISNHLANNPQTVGIIGKSLIDSMKPYSTFINTGRGAQVDEKALANKLALDPTVTAVLDVTNPEPPAKDSPLLSLPNAILTPHIAGSAGNEVQRMAEYMAEESARFFGNKACLFEVTMKMLETMA